MKINFVLNGINSHSFNRIDEFKKLGYQVEVFGFSRDITRQYDKDVKILGSFPNSTPYLHRIRLIWNALVPLFKNTRKDDIEWWYYFGLQMCIFCTVLNNNKKFLYEESDMIHLSIRNGFIRWVLEWMNKRFIRKSLMTIFTSEGFLQYHYGNNKEWPSNYVIMPNKIHPDILNFPLLSKAEPSHHNLRFAFVGYIRYESVYHIADIISKNFPQHEFHFYGEFLLDSIKEEFMTLNRRKNVFFHGFFKNPDELPKIYSNIDVVVSNYDVNYINERYLEPNKLYESIYFRTPIIVTKGTFLAQKVNDLHCGWDVDARCEKEVVNMVHMIEHNINKVINQIEEIPQSFAIDDPCVLAEKLISIV